jgi:hypothetical protein
VPTSAAPTTRRTNLRTALTSFVGREDHLDRALTDVRTQRLTTVTLLMSPVGAFLFGIWGRHAEVDARLANGATLNR